MKLRTLFILVLIFAGSLAHGQNAIREYAAPGIKSVIFGKKDFPLSYPVLEMGEENPLLLSFDDLSKDLKSYFYSITLCNADWSDSRLNPSEYSTGLFSFPVSDYQPSVNTLVPYTHYQITLPNNDLQLKLPGNYILKVFENNDASPVLVKRFVYADHKVDVSARVRIPTLPEYQETSQQLDFTILNPDFPITNPHQQLSVVIIKNFDWNTALTTLKPQFIRNGSLDYNYTRENLFIAGNEYRSFNINSRKYPSPEVTGIIDEGHGYTVLLATDKPRNTYFFKEDINGLFINENKDVRNADNSVESDYFNVNFSLTVNLLPSDGDIFIYGGLTGFDFNEDNRMKYNAGKNIYENTLLLKQGYYDYQYVFIPKTTGTFNETEIEGSFSETGNNYFILVYYRGFGERYDRLIGYREVGRKE